MLALASEPLTKLTKGNMKRKFTKNGYGFGVRVFVYSNDYQSRVKITLAHYIATRITWFNDEEIALELSKRLGHTLVKLARLNATHRWGIIDTDLGIFKK